MPLTATIKIKLRRGTLAEWTASDPLLLEGEVGIITELINGSYVAQEFVIGNGVDAFSILHSNTNNVFYPGLSLGDMLKSIYDTNDNSAVDIAETLRIEVINKTGSTIGKGKIVYLKSSSSSSNHPEVLLASASTEATSSKTIGAVYDDIANDAIGWIVLKGEVYNANTNAYNVGDKLWLSTVAGEVTIVPPTQPNHTVFIGHVTRKQNNNGRIVYTIYNGYELNELHDVLISSIQNDEILQWDSSTSLWKNKPFNQSKIDYDSSITGLRNSSNTIYTTSQSFKTGTLKVYMNGLLLSPGAGNDYVVINSNTFQFNYPPDSGDLLIAEYIKA
jgi:hypothetical protein